MNVDKLKTRVEHLTAKSSDLIHNQQMRNIAFCSAGNLSKGSRSKLNAHREKLGVATEKSIAAKLALSFAEGKSISPHEIQQKFITCSTPVELEKFNNLAMCHPNQLALGEADRLARLVVSKFDKRRAKSIVIPIEMGGRVFSLDPKRHVK